MIVSPNDYLEFTLCLQFILNESFECGLLLYCCASLFRRNRNLKVQNLVYIIALEMSSIFALTTPVNLDPSFHVSTVIDITKNIGFVYLDTYILFSECDKLIFTLLSPFRKATNVYGALNNTSLGWLVQVIVINNLSFRAVFSVNNHIT